MKGWAQQSGISQSRRWPLLTTWLVYWRVIPRNASIPTHPEHRVLVISEDEDRPFIRYIPPLNNT